MPCGHSGRGLMLAGLIVMLVGLGIVLIRTFHIPGYWIPLAVGAALLLVGAVRQRHSGGT